MSQSTEKPQKPKGKADLTKEEIEEIIRLHLLGLGARTIGERMRVGRKVIRGILEEQGYSKQKKNQTLAVPQIKRTRASKLDPFRLEIQKKVELGLTAERIFRELTEREENKYEGGITILRNYVNSLKTQPSQAKKVWRRFETRPGEEIQVDWSSYRVPVGDKQRVVHAFAAVLAHSRKIHVRFYINERQSTLLEAHSLAFADFQGVTQRVVYDHMSTVVLGSVGPQREPLWHPRFLEFARYYAFEPYLCRVADPDRKGKDERVFWYLERDFIRGSSFASLDDLNARIRLWLDKVANCRVHGTTRRVPDEAWEQERPFLIPLPESRFSTCDEESRTVGPDSVLSIAGTRYTVPHALADRVVTVRLYAEHFDVLDQKGHIAFSRRYVSEEEKGKLIIDPAHYEGIKRAPSIPGGSAARLEESFLMRFPALADLVDGIKRRMKGLAHIHLRSLWRLAELHGDEPFLEAAQRAQKYRRFDAQAIHRILERQHPLPMEPPTPGLHAAARALLALGDVDHGSLDDYAHLDDPENKGDNDEQE